MVMGKAYFLAPTRDCPPSGPIALGNIIVSPSVPEEALNSNLIPPTETIHESYQTNWQAEMGHHKDGKLGIWTGFLQFLGIGVDVGVEHSRYYGDIYRFDRLETHFFLPSTEYVEKCVRSPNVQDHIIKSRFRSNIYMVTGIKIARGASIASIRLRERGTYLHFGVNGAPLGLPLSIGPEASISSASTHSVSFDGASDFVFAFRLREIHYSQKQKVTHRSYDKGVLSGIHDGTEDVAEVPTEEIDVLGPADKDLTGEDVDEEALSVLDDDGEPCECVRIA